ncbi:hypothetical protein QR680_001731 [Steinernema hermaphroditum]|uniref:Peptidase M13 C-terminal domain-containing protein n=1 Tax=Steinernema hermaphroditum TaxID=289476 RepID=A0AA39H1A7_9BILA|nr:hypothetical protein QR680_001731 [Steinernema hermaphroditum]
MVIFKDSVLLTDIVIDAEELSISPFGNVVEEPLELFVHEDLASSFNAKINPCDDFYEYVCYNWAKRHPVKEYELRSNQMSVNVEKVNLQLLDILKTKEDYGKNRINTLLYDAFDQCVNSKERNELRSKPLFNALRIVRNSHFPYITDWLIHVQPISLFYKVDVGPNFKNTSYNTLFLNIAGTFFTYYYYIEPQYAKHLLHIKSYLINTLKLLQTDDQDIGFFRLSESDIKRRMQSFINVETAVAKILNGSQRDDGRSNADRSNLQTSKKLQEIAPSINWKRYITGLLPEAVLSNITIEDMTFEIEDVDSITQLESLIQNLPNETLADYLEWKIILNYAGYLDDRYLNLKLELDHVLYGVEAQQPREQSCISDVTSFFSDAVSALYVRKYFSNESRTMVREIVDFIREAYADRLNRTKWMDEDTKQDGIRKVHDMIEFIGYSDHIFDSKEMTTKYENLSFDSSMPYMDIVVKLGKWNTQTSFAQLIERNTRDKFEFMATDVNAFYDPSLNQIALLAGILQGAYFNKSLPAPMNYGGIGVVIGHEMMHGFDDAGNEFDSNGSRRTWFDSFQEMRQCFVQQYGRIQVLATDMAKVNGEQTARENIADNGGIRAAYAAMLKELRRRHLDRRHKITLDRVGNFTFEQLFFISHAFTWCGSVRPEALIDQVLNDNHTPDKYRVNIVMANFPEFFSAFQCPTTSAMRLNATCAIW